MILSNADDAGWWPVVMIVRHSNRATIDIFSPTRRGKLHTDCVLARQETEELVYDEINGWCFA
jgi:hypothetical protein